MDEAPQYSPTSPRGHFQLPHDYNPRDDDQDPLTTLTRPKAPRVRHDSLSQPSSSHQVNENALRPIVTAPPFVAEFPPTYAPLDDLVRSFQLCAPFIYATKTSNLPRYQLMQEFTRSGYSRGLHIRRLLATESRRASFSSSSISRPDIRYDKEGTMYHMSGREMKGQRESTLRGTIQIESGTGWRGKWCKIYRLTKNPRKDMLNPENERKMQKYGYHSNEEWDKRLLFLIRKDVWEDGDGKVVAKELQNGFEIEDAVDGPRRDLLVSCWIFRIYMYEGVRWEDDVKGR